MQHTHTHTHTCLTALFPGLPRRAGTRKGKPIWILLKHETVSGSGISWAMCKSAPRSRQITTPAPHHSVFCRPDALPAAQPTASKHWKQVMQHRWDKWQEDDECSLCGPPSSPRDCQCWILSEPFPQRPGPLCCPLTSAKVGWFRRCHISWTSFQQASFMMVAYKGCTLLTMLQLTGWKE